MICELQTGGPYIEVLTGRRDSYSASRERADNQLPLANISTDDCIQIFRQKNISLEQGVALLGIELCMQLCFCFTLPLIILDYSSVCIYM